MMGSASTNQTNNNTHQNHNNKRKRQGQKRRLDKDHDQIVIIGSGLAGLSCVLSLKQAGFTNIRIFERDTSFDEQKEGYGLTLTYNPKGPLAKLGLLEQVAQQDCPSRSHYVFESNGSILGYFGNAFYKHRGLGQRGNLRVPRKVLRGMLVQALEEIGVNIHWGCRFKNAIWNVETNQYTIEVQENDNNDLKESSIIVTTADLLVAADGIRSSVLGKLVYQVKDDNNSYKIHKCIGLQKVGVRLILGIADFNHPLLEERGFYTLDGKHRLFTMPYESNRYSSDQKKIKKNRIMWQLSFATPPDYEESLDPKSLQRYVLETCRPWHNPVLDMIQQTPIQTIWGTDLMDRSPKEVLAEVQNRHISRLVVVGDALHTMTPFKGQGANQALADGPLLAKWLTGSKVDSAIIGFWREIVNRTAPVVAASHHAAIELHSKAALSSSSHGFAGIKSNTIVDFVSLLKAQNIGANFGKDLDTEVAKLIGESKVSAEEEDEPISPKFQRQALALATIGDTQGLRILSLAKQSQSIRLAKDSSKQNKTCLHLAMEGGHIATCKWLLTEVGCSPNLVDDTGNTFLDYAPTSEAKTVLSNYCSYHPI